MPYIAYNKVNEPYGWLGNMSPSQIVYEGFEYRTVEALFQCLRFENMEIRKEIREQLSPMAAKMISKRERRNMVVVPMSDQDLNNMRICLGLKFQIPTLRRALIDTADHDLIEDINTRRGERHLFWGAYREQQDGNIIWRGHNNMGKLLMEIREKIKADLH
jgi:ribA/ribD-fused uncharacterized protein